MPPDEKPILKPLLSILLPVYNVGNYINECLTLINQAVVDANATNLVEVVLVDDCSTDNSITIIKHFLSTADCKLRLVQHEINKGVSQTRNTLLGLARGQYIWFVDPDDKPAVPSIAKIIKNLTIYEPDLIIFDWFTQNDKRLNRHGQPKTRRRRGATGAAGLAVSNPQDMTSRVLLTDKLYVWNKIFKRSLSDNIVFPDQRNFEDIAFSVSLLLNSQRTLYIKDTFITYRHREGSIVNSLNSEKMDDWRQALCSMHNIIANVNEAEKKLRIAASYSLYNNYFDIISKYLSEQVAQNIQHLFNEMAANVFIPFRSLLLHLILSGHPIRAWQLLKKEISMYRKLQNQRGPCR